MANPTGKGGFQERKYHINRNGRPKNFDKFRALAQQIAHEVPKDKNGDDLAINDHLVTVTEMILRQWASSKNPQLQKAFIEYAYGKVPDKHELTGENGGELRVKFIDYGLSTGSDDNPESD